jgi:hypothetical protein
MCCDVVETAKALIATLGEFVDQVEFICDDYQDSLRVEGFLEGVDRSLNELLERDRRFSLSCLVEAAMAGDAEAQAELKEWDQEHLRRQLLTLGMGEDDPNAISYLKWRFGIDLSGEG